MTIFLTVLISLLFAALVFVAALQPVKPPLSLNELKRRARDSRPAAVLDLDRYELYSSVVTLLRVLQVLLLVLLVGVSIAAFGWLGVLVALVLALGYAIVARLSLAQKGAAAVYRRYEHRILDFVAHFEGVFYTLRDPQSTASEPVKAVHSIEELSEVIEASKDAIGASERWLISSALSFKDTTISSVMTPRATIDFVKASEFLGPLVLSELHNLGHSRLPVIGEDLNHIVGVLHLRDLLSLDVKRSMTAEKLMEKKVYYIHENDSLQHALAAFLKTRHHLFIVINELRETVGLVTLEDVIEALIGQRIVDEDDIHADLRAVAAQESKTNNTAPGHIDL